MVLFHTEARRSSHPSIFESYDFQFGETKTLQGLKRKYELQCAEMYMMAAKAYTFNDEKTFDLIINCTQGPKKIKELGRSVKNRKIKK